MLSLPKHGEGFFSVLLDVRSKRPSIRRESQRVRAAFSPMGRV